MALKENTSIEEPYTGEGQIYLGLAADICLFSCHVFILGLHIRPTSPVPLGEIFLAQTRQAH